MSACIHSRIPTPLFCPNVGDGALKELDEASVLVEGESLTRQWKTGNPLRAHKVGGKV